MRRLLLTAALLALAAVSAVGYAAHTRDVEYRRLITSGQRALASGDSVTAVEAFSGAIALRPDAMLGWYQRGATYRQRGDLTSALRDLRQATALDPGATRAIELLGDVLFALERHARAAETYEHYLALDDRSPRVLYKLALSRFRGGRSDEAESALTQAIRQQDRLPEAHYLLGVCLSERRQMGPALASLRKAVDQAPALAEARELLATLYHRLGRPAEEVRQLEALVALGPDRAERHVALALAYSRQGRREQALLTLNRASRQFPDSPAPHVALGRIWLDVAAESEYDDPVALQEAIGALRRAAEYASSSEALTLLGRALLRAGDLRGARRALEQATSLLPVDPAAYALLAEAAERTGRPLAARDALVRAAALAGDGDPRTTARRAARIAVLSTRLGDHPAASYWYGRALAASPDDPHLTVLLAKAQWRAGHRDDARATLSRALERRPDDDELVAARKGFR
jgi:tetratricopeptide (TPR) repeat protein